MQESRLFRIIYYLLEKGEATASELAEKLEVSTRTIYRDIDALSGAGIPVYSESGRNGGIRLLNSFVLEKAIFSEHEKREILAALQSLTAVGNTYQKETLEKLSALFHVSTENWFEVDFSRWGEQKQDNEKFESLKNAIIHHRCVKIVYTGTNGAEEERTIHPIKLLYKSRAWYLKAYCTKKEDFRIFRVNRILKWELLDDSFSPISFPDFDATHQQMPDEVRLRFPREMAYRVYDEFDASQVSREENGNLIASAPMPVDEWLIGFLLSFGAQVEVIEPKYLKTILAERAKEIYERNFGGMGKGNIERNFAGEG